MITLETYTIREACSPGDVVAIDAERGIWKADPLRLKTLQPVGIAIVPLTLGMTVYDTFDRDMRTFCYNGAPVIISKTSNLPIDVRGLRYTHRPNDTGA